MKKKLPFEDKIRSFLDKSVGIENLKRVEYLLSPFVNTQSFLGACSRSIKAITEVGVVHDWSRQNKKVKENLNIDGVHHLNSNETFLSYRSRELLAHIRVCLRFMADGRLAKTYKDVDWSDRVIVYHYYEYTLGRSIKIYLVKQISEADGEIWLGDVFSTENSMESLIQSFRNWFWDMTGGSVFFTNKAMGGTEVLAPIIQNLCTNQPFIGKFGPEEVYEYWQDFKKDNISRSLLFVGGPGTGKTSTVREIAATYHLNLARLDPHVLQKLMDEDSFSIWNSLFQPDIILIDDVHGIGVNSGLACVLSILEHISNTITKDTLVIGTANKLENVDIALRRPGRFDAAFHFTSQGFEGEILDLYAQTYEVEDLVAPKRDWLIKHFKNLSPAYMKEVVKNIKALSHRADLWEFVGERMKLMVELSDDNYNAELLSNKKEKESAGFKTDEPSKMANGKDSKPQRTVGFGP